MLEQADKDDDEKLCRLNKAGQDELLIYDHQLLGESPGKRDRAQCFALSDTHGASDIYGAAVADGCLSHPELAQYNKCRCPV